MDKEIRYSEEVIKAIDYAKIMVFTLRNDFLTPEHILNALLRNESLRRALRYVGADVEWIEKEISDYLDSLDSVPEEMDYQPEFSSQSLQMINDAINQLLSSEVTELKLEHLIFSMMKLKDSTAAYVMDESIRDNFGEFLSAMLEDGDEYFENNNENHSYNQDSDEPVNASAEKSSVSGKSDNWKSYVVCVNDTLEGRNPLIGRAKELDRTIQVLCRKEKNNPLHIGDPGVGKTALVYGLARLINDGKVPDRLKGARIYSLEVGSLLAGTQFRGDFEKRLKVIMDGVCIEKNAIVYIDEIHTLVGAGATGEGSMDASNMLKPYLESGRIRFIGSTTYDEYKRYFARSKGLVRRFSNIDISEPSVDETIDILKQLKGNYENYHKVTYLPEALEYAVQGSVSHIPDRRLPDKALDLIDEAGALRQLHPAEGNGKNIIDKAVISDVLARVCKVEAVKIQENEAGALDTLEERISSRIYGQEKAVRAVVEAVQMSKAGLSDEGKPLASLLFVGPTGVGKTELAKTLAQELGIGFVRFDMSEYSEKHAVAKLIGAPAGYVGYDDGGLLTDAVRKTPDCVLLLDEIEKAHSDIYNILLQVMDYGRLTDNKGNHADFRNVVLIMTSNAGARYASRANVGFSKVISAGNAMLTQIKKTFQPEFLNRLSATVVFNDMDRHMASLILDRQLRLLEDKLTAKSISLKLDEEAREYLLDAGYSKEYGAREMDRVINSKLKPLLMREILFGKLKNGGEAHITLADLKLKDDAHVCTD